MEINSNIPNYIAIMTNSIFITPAVMLIDTLFRKYPERHRNYFHRKKFSNILNDALNALSNKKKRIYNLEEIIYRKAFVSERSFSYYLKYGVIPERDDILKVAFVLECSLELTERLLKSVGHAFIEGDNRDKIIKKCFEKKIFCIPVVNEILEKEGETLICY